MQKQKLQDGVFLRNLKQPVLKLERLDAVSNKGQHSAAYDQGNESRTEVSGQEHISPRKPSVMESTASR